MEQGSGRVGTALGTRQKELHEDSLVEHQTKNTRARSTDHQVPIPAPNQILAPSASNSRQPELSVAGGEVATGFLVVEVVVGRRGVETGFGRALVRWVGGDMPGVLCRWQAGTPSFADG